MFESINQRGAVLNPEQAGFVAAVINAAPGRQRPLATWENAGSFGADFVLEQTRVWLDDPRSGAHPFGQRIAREVVALLEVR